MTTVLVLGGARSGKSRYAEHLVGELTHVVYVATAATSPGDEEWQERIAAHRRRRPAAWTTAETTDVVHAVRVAPAGSGVLIDCLGTWLTRLADDAGTWDDRAATARVWDAAAGRLAAAVQASAAHVVLVSNETGMGVVPATPAGRTFRDGLGRVNVRLADVCDRTYLVAAGRVVDLSDSPRVADAPRLTGPS